MSHQKLQRWGSIRISLVAYSARLNTPGNLTRTNFTVWNPGIVLDTLINAHAS
jgi:hypothetical protein